MTERHFFCDTDEAAIQFLLKAGVTLECRWANGGIWVLWQDHDNTALYQWQHDDVIFRIANDPGQQQT